MNQGKLENRCYCNCGCTAELVHYASLCVPCASGDCVQPPTEQDADTLREDGLRKTALQILEASPDDKAYHETPDGKCSFWLDMNDLQTIVHEWNARPAPEPVSDREDAPDFCLKTDSDDFQEADNCMDCGHAVERHTSLGCEICLETIQAYPSQPSPAPAFVPGDAGMEERVQTALGNFMRCYECGHVIADCRWTHSRLLYEETCTTVEGIVRKETARLQDRLDEAERVIERYADKTRWRAEAGNAGDKNYGWNLEKVYCLSGSSHGYGEARAYLAKHKPEGDD